MQPLRGLARRPPALAGGGNTGGSARLVVAARARAVVAAAPAPRHRRPSSLRVAALAMPNNKPPPPAAPSPKGSPSKLLSAAASAAASSRSTATTTTSSSASPELLLAAEGEIVGPRSLGGGRRHVFTFERWEMHRSSMRYFRHLSTVFRSRTFIGLSAPIALITAFAAFAGVYESVFVPKGWPEINIGDVPLQITAFALSLLLTTRTESSNKRYEEALTVWSQVVRNESKDLARQSLYWVSEAQPSVRAALVRWTAAFSRALMCHCRPGGDAALAAATRGVLLPHESAALAAEGSGAAPAMVLQVLAELVEQAQVPGIRRENMFQSLRQLGDAVGRCEKLIRYPLPLAWTRHTSRFLIMWLLALPFALWEDCGWAVVPLTNLCGLLLLGIDSIGVELEDAMRAVDIEGICEDVSADVVAMLERQERVAGMLRDSGVEACASRACGRTWALGSSADEDSAASSAAAAAAGGGLLTLVSLASGAQRRGISRVDEEEGADSSFPAVPLFGGGQGLPSGMSWDEGDEVAPVPFGRYGKKPAAAAAEEEEEEGAASPTQR
jgi:ion channel-forming bestrophin family protein